MKSKNKTKPSNQKEQPCSSRIQELLSCPAKTHHTCHRRRVTERSSHPFQFQYTGQKRRSALRLEPHSEGRCRTLSAARPLDCDRGAPGSPSPLGKPAAACACPSATGTEGWASGCRTHRGARRLQAARPLCSCPQALSGLSSTAFVLVFHPRGIISAFNRSLLCRAITAAPGFTPTD